MMVLPRDPRHEAVSYTMPATPELKPFIIDTDMASDDWMAVLYLLQCPAIEIKAIAVTGAGQAHLGPGMRTALRLLALAGQPDIPVAGGRKTPLRGNRKFPLAWRLSTDVRLGLSLPRSNGRPADPTAVELITDVITNSLKKVTVVALGPLTNLAEAIEAAPALVHGIEMVYLMGGAVNVSGNLKNGRPKTDNEVAEWNIYVDPYAAGVVFGSGVPLTLVPLDATNQTPATMDFYARCEAHHTTPEAEFVYRLLRRLKSAVVSGEYYFWDPLAAVIATDPDIATTDSRLLTVIQKEGPECGRTTDSETGNPIKVCLDADQGRFESIFWNTLNGDG